VPDPDRAVALPGAVVVLAYLAERMATVAVVSGRPLAFLRHHLHPPATSPLILAGLYGLERAPAPRPDPALPGRPLGALDSWRAVVGEAAGEAAGAMPPGTRLEDKGLTLVLHYRGAPDQADQIGHLARSLAIRHHLDERPAKLAIELVPPLPVDKGSVARELSEGRAVACFFGDDTGDLAAFDALEALSARDGLVALRVAIAGEDAPAGLIDAADLVLDGPTAAVDLLLELARRLGWSNGPPGHVS